MEGDVGDLNAVPDLGGSTISHGQLIQAAVFRFELAFGRQEDIFVADGKGLARARKFGVDGLDEQHAGGFAYPWPFLQARYRRFHLNRRLTGRGCWGVLVSNKFALAERAST